MSPWRRILSLLCLTNLLLAWRGAAQAPTGQIDSLASVLASGDSKVRARLSEVVRQGSFGGETGRRDAGMARAIARGALALGGQISDADAVLHGAEREWRPYAVRALWQAIELDPRDSWSMERLEDLAPYPHLWKSPEDELRILVTATDKGAAISPRLLRTAVHLELELDHTDAAARLALEHPDPSMAQRHHLFAEIAFAKGDDAAASEAYFRGARAIGSTEEASSYRVDLVWIAEQDELREWDALGNGAHEQWLRAFWGKRDLADARLPGTRLPEHFRRWRFALKSHRWEVDGSTVVGLDIPPAAANERGIDDILFPRRISPVNEVNLENSLLPRSRVLDDRGRLTMRLGVPGVVNLPGITAVSEENLYWLTPAGRVVVGFSKPTLPGDPNRVGLDRWGMIARNHPTGDLLTTCAVDARLCALAGLIEINKRGQNAAVTDLATATSKRYDGMRQFAEKADLNAETFRDSLGATVQAYGVMGGGVLVVVAIPLDRLQRADSTNRNNRLAANIRVIIGNPATGEIVTALDTTRSWRGPVSAPPGSLVSSYLLVPAPTGSWSVSTVISDERREFGTGVRFNTVPVAEKGTNRVVISDPIIGRGNGGLSWQHNGESVPLNPTNAWRRDEPALLSYEIDGRVVGRTYETRYELWKTNGKPKSPSNVITTKGAASAVTEMVHRELSLKELDAGTYRLVVRVKDMVTGSESVRERMIPVRK